MTPSWDEPDPRKLEADELLKQMGVQGGGSTGGMKLPSDASPVDTPTSGTMPVGGELQTRVNHDPAPIKPTAPAPSRTPYTGFTPAHDFSAFNTAREQNPEKSAKDAFAMLSNQAPPPPFHDKAALGQWFTQYIKPGMDALGHTVSSVDGDKFSYGNHEGNFSVDYAQNAGAAPGSMLQRVQWGAEAADDATRQRYAPGGSGAGAFTPRASTPISTPGSVGLPGQTLPPGWFGASATTPGAGAPDAMQAILKEIQALTQGQQSPMDSEALLALLQQGGVA